MNYIAMTCFVFLKAFLVAAIVYKSGTINKHIPFVVSIQKKVNNYYEHICVGSIISKSVVLSAAHCFIQNPDARKLSVVGGTNLMSTSLKHFRRSVEKVLKHQHFYPLKGNDAALIKVSPNFKFDGRLYSKVRFIMGNNIKSDNLDGFLVGWGRMPLNTNKKLELVEFHSISDKSCLKQNFRHITDTDICALANGYRGACDGDSGAPLLTRNLKVQFGILSYGKTICSGNVIYVFTKLSRLRNWINSSLFKI